MRAASKPASQLKMRWVTQSALDWETELGQHINFVSKPHTVSTQLANKPARLASYYLCLLCLLCFLYVSLFLCFACFLCFLCFCYVVVTYVFLCFLCFYVFYVFGFMFSMFSMFFYVFLCLFQEIVATKP